MSSIYCDPHADESCMVPPPRSVWYGDPHTDDAESGMVPPAQICLVWCPHADESGIVHLSMMCLVYIVTPMLISLVWCARPDLSGKVNPTLMRLSLVWCPLPRSVWYSVPHADESGMFPPAQICLVRCPPR